MIRGPRMIAAAALAALAVPAAAEAHVSFHPNALPAKSEVTVDLRVPNEIDNGNITSVAPEVSFPFAELVGLDAAHAVDGVHFDHVTVAGKPLSFPTLLFKGRDLSSPESR